jgi:hypothetical protein
MQGPLPSRRALRINLFCRMHLDKDTLAKRDADQSGGAAARQSYTVSLYLVVSCDA